MRDLRTLAVLIPLLAGCDGPQSAFRAAGKGAADIHRLFLTMAAGAVVIWAVVIGLSVFAVWSRISFHRRWTAGLVIGGGVFFPTAVLTGLLCYGLSMLPELNAPAPKGSLTIEVDGVQWWWRVRYLVDGQPSVELANEVVLPAGEQVEFKLESEDVIHSFWIPSLGGKVDMIPGRRTRLKLQPLREGNYRGVCAEYCGTAHAQMAFDVRVVSRAEFNSWLESQASSARFAEDPPPSVAQGATLFRQVGCSACHAIRGTPATGSIGPDLTHLGGRATLGAGILPTTQENLQRWVTAPELIKPGVEMPPFDWLSPTQIEALATYLMHLK